jgi:LIVCS family branched-chain amino acid:cation transporter
VSNIGLSAIIAVAAPILSIVFPSALVMIFLSLAFPNIKNHNVHRFAAVGALVISIIETCHSYGMGMDFITKLPLSGFGFGWVLPALLMGIIGSFLKRKPC